MTQLSILAEFDGAHAMIAEANAIGIADTLRDRGVWIVTGSSDDRVRTNSAIRLLRASCWTAVTRPVTG